MRIPAPLSVAESDAVTLRSWVTGDSVGAAAARRARIVLLARAGLGPSAIAAELRCSKQTVITWRERYRSDGIAGLRDAPRSGRPATVDAAAVVAHTLGPPGPGAARWSTRRLAAALGISNVAVANVWRTWGITPGSLGRVRLGTEPTFDGPVVGVVGLHLDPPLRLLAVLVGAPDGGFGPPPAADPGLGSWLAEIDPGPGAGSEPALADFLAHVDHAGHRPDLSDAPATPRLLVEEATEPLRRWVDARPGAVLHTVPAPLSWMRLVRAATVLATATARGAASVVALRSAAERHPAGEPFSWIDAAANSMQQERDGDESGARTSFTDERHPKGSERATGTRIPRNSRSFSG